MAELATIARPYAEALFQVAPKATWLDAVACVAVNPAMLEFAAAPKATPEQVFEVLEKTSKTKLNGEAKNFLKTVIDNGRLAAMGEIAKQYTALQNAQSGVAQAIVYSPFPMAAKAMTSLKTLLEDKFGRKLELVEQTDETLIAGVRVVVGDEVLDTSVKARLEKMKTTLTA